MGGQTRPWGPSGDHPPLKLLTVCLVGEADADTSEMLSVCQEPLEAMVHPAGPWGWDLALQSPVKPLKQLWRGEAPGTGRGH